MGRRGRIISENVPGRRPSRYGIRSEGKLDRAALERSMPIRYMVKGRSVLRLCELHICSSDAAF